MKLRGGLGVWGGGSLLLISIVSATLIVADGFWSAGNASGGNTDNSAFTGACKKLPSPSAPGFTNRFNEFVTNLCYQKQNWEHDANRRTSQNIHDALVKIWYSPLLFKWMTVLNRQGPIPDGAIAIKEEYGDSTGPIQFWSGMVHDSSLWWDGWYWSVVGTEVTGAAPAAASATSGCAEAVFPTSGPTSVNCIGCHASAISTAPGAGTYSGTEFIASTTSAGAAGSIAADAQLPAFAAHLQAQADPDPASGFTGRLPSSIFANVRKLPAATIPCLVPESLDQVTSKPASKGGPSLFVTSNQCASCHDATNNAPMPTHMLYTPPGSSTPVNLSTYGEWRYSIIALGPRPYILRPTGYRIDHTCQNQRQEERSRVCSGYVFILPRSNGTAPVPPGQRKRTKDAIHPRSTAKCHLAVRSAGA